MFNFLLNLASYKSTYGSGYGSGYSSYSSPRYYSSSSSSSIDPEEIFEVLGPLTGVIIVVAIIVGIISLILAILQIVAEWKVFVKAGRKGWECLVPCHSTFELLDMSNINPIFILVFLFGTIIPLVGTIAVYVLIFYLYIKLAKSFGRSAGFGVGLVLLPFIFWPILGLGKSQYQGTYFTSQEQNKAPTQTVQEDK